MFEVEYQRWSRGHKARGQGHKKIRGQGQGQPFRGQTLSRPRPGMLEAKDQGHKRKCSPKKKRSAQKFFKRSPQKNVFQNIFQALHKILAIQKVVLSSSREQANFRGLEASRPRPRTSKSVLEDSTSVEYLKTAESRRMKSTPIESNSIGLTFDTPIDVAFSPRLNSTKLIHYILFKLNYQQFKWCGCINAANRRYKQNAKAQFLVTDFV